MGVSELDYSGYNPNNGEPNGKDMGKRNGNPKL